MLEEDTNRLLDGMHRYQAHRQLGLAEIAAEYHVIPEGVPARLYAASLSARNGDRLSGQECREVVLDAVEANPDLPMVDIAKLIGVTRQTVSKWASPITERRKWVRKVRVLLLSRLGWSNRGIGEFLRTDETTVRRDVNDDILPHLGEDLLRNALDGLPSQCTHIAEEIREEWMFASWSDEERALLKRLRDGETIVVNMRDGVHDHLVTWAGEAGLFVRIDRRSEWGNPFELDKDGDRDTVIRHYDEHYLPHKPSLQVQLPGLRGRALGCWCAPWFCHGDVLKARVDENEPCMEPR